jgi:VCBS repeat-containing protein
MVCEPLEQRNLLAVISGFVFVDADADGVRDDGEAGIPGVQVTLTGTPTSGSAVNQTVLSQSNGSYTFNNLAAGTYTLNQIQPDPMLDGQESSSATGATIGSDQIANLVLATDQTIANNNFGERGLGPDYVSLRNFLASTPPATDMLRETIADSEDAAGNSELADSIRAGDTAPPNQNAAPVGVADTYTVAEGGTLTVPVATGVLTNDTDAEGNTLTAQVVTTTTRGTLALAANGSFTYTPNADFNGTDTFTYRANDGTANSADTTVTITVTGENDAPTAVNDSYTTGDNTTLTTTTTNGVLANDTDPEGNTLTASLVTNVSSGTLTLNPNGTFTYTPANGFTGNVTFTYRANDGTANSNTATVTINVTDANQAPVAVANAYSTNENTTLTVAQANGVLANDTDADNDTLTAELVSNVSSGTLNLASNGSFSYVPANGFSGNVSFTYRANDGTTTSNTVTVTITVNSSNQAPVAVANSYTTNENSPLTVNQANGVLTNDTDADGDTLTAQLVSNVTSGTLNLASNGSFTYTPATNFSGSVSFTYRANDGTTTSNTVTVTITVNDLPANSLFGEVVTGSYTQSGLLGDRMDLVSGAPPVSATHVDGDIDYTGYSNPPTYGPHHPFDPTGTDVNPGITPRTTGVHTTEQPDEDLIHNLEHGHVWISYDPTLISSGDLMLLQQFVRDGSPNANGAGVGVILTPREANDSMIAVASWGRLLKMNSYDPVTLRQFVEANRGKAPEGFITP